MMNLERREASMKRTAILLLVTLALGVALGMVGHGLLSAQPQAITRTPLQKLDLIGTEGKELNMWLSELAPGAASGRHYHPGDEALYVLEGTVTLEYDDKPAVTVKAGESAYNAPKLVHNAKNASTTPVKIVTFMVSEKGQPLAIPVP
jgi:quercetin dioxygenase-like cupin family protein